MLNCGGLRLVDWLSGQKQVFWWGDWSQSNYLGDYLVTLSVNSTGIYRMMIPGASDPPRKILDIDGTVYIDGVHIIQSTGRSFDVGGYLGAVNHAFTFKLGTSTTQIFLPTLAVIPAAYSGGLRITNLNDPGTTFNPSSGTLFVQPYPEWNAATVLINNGISADVYNFVADDSTTTSGIEVDARVRGAIGFDFHIQIHHV